MAVPRVLGYDDLYDYLESCVDTEQSLADDLDDEGKDGAELHWAKAEAYRDMIRHIEAELTWARG